MRAEDGKSLPGGTFDNVGVSRRPATDGNSVGESVARTVSTMAAVSVAVPGEDVGTSCVAVATAIDSDVTTIAADRGSSVAVANSRGISSSAKAIFSI